MNTKSKYIGLIIDCYWQVRETKKADDNHTNYIIMNLCNGKMLEVGGNCMFKLATGKTQVCKVIRRRIKKNIPVWLN